MAGKRLGDDPTLMGCLKAIREGRIRARDLADRAIDAHVPMLRAYTAWSPEGLRTQAEAVDSDFAAGRVRGPLQGVPVSIKDNIALSGWETRAGSESVLPPPWQQDGPVAARLRRQQAIFTGKTQTVAFAFTSLGTSPAGEGPRNPWDPSKVCGGSSSGAAVSVAEGSAALALGTDTAGSVRVPAAMTGTVGLKLTHGRLPATGVVPLSHSLDSLGLLARSVADIAIGVAALEGREGDGLSMQKPLSLAGVRIGLPKAMFWEGCDPSIAEAAWQALRELEAAGARLIDFEFPEARAADALFREGGLVGTELSLFLALQLPAWLERLGPDMAEDIAQAGALSAGIYQQRLRRMSRLAAQAVQRFAEVDVVATPTVPMPAPCFSEVDDEEYFLAANGRILRNTAFINYLHLCALTMPVGLDTFGMPVGLQLIARGFDEARLLAIALGAERRLGAAPYRLGRNAWNG
ncbi:aspartyl-tRNA(Asn)/glutamyl-tRNA(Gln) amidotransferase subunit A [Modicisalibacter muralis]|uniref:Aspartyl-tRNA(Asn)/glutamyl-tRNA(Gln) amidotransferase subunit A n=1 Tax=Modicisalibacter muralis TaxID=119000 RepID=A0A1G9NSN7_9GAMM|nr:amidase [Halomonas muralis]SDL89323.1 aspartyl-tRNA(Asn)/glutamyl-tRNA(Gln) amidotransferase subunit A [Halomonas muralis]